MSDAEQARIKDSQNPSDVVSEHSYAELIERLVHLAGTIEEKVLSLDRRLGHVERHFVPKDVPISGSFEEEVLNEQEHHLTEEQALKNLDESSYTRTEEEVAPVALDLASHLYYNVQEEVKHEPMFGDLRSLHATEFFHIAAARDEPNEENHAEGLPLKSWALNESQMIASRDLGKPLPDAEVKALLESTFPSLQKQPVEPSDAETDFSWLASSKSNDALLPWDEIEENLLDEEVNPYLDETLLTPGEVKLDEEVENLQEMAQETWQRQEHYREEDVWTKNASFQETPVETETILELVSQEEEESLNSLQSELDVVADIQRREEFEEQLIDQAFVSSLTKSGQILVDEKKDFIAQELTPLAEEVQEDEFYWQKEKTLSLNEESEDEFLMDFVTQKFSSSESLYDFLASSLGRVRSQQEQDDSLSLDSDPWQRALETLPADLRCELYQVVHPFLDLLKDPDFLNEFLSHPHYQTFQDLLTALRDHKSTFKA